MNGMGLRWQRCVAATVLGLLVSLTLSACDSNEDDPEPSLAGTWSITSVRIGGSDTNVLPLLGLSGAGVSIEENGTYSVFGQSGGEPFETNGTYTVDPADGTLTLTSDSFEGPITFDYSVSGNTLELSGADASLLAELAGIELPIPIQGSVIITFSRQ